MFYVAHIFILHFESENFALNERCYCFHGSLRIYSIQQIKQIKFTYINEMLYIYIYILFIFMYTFNLVGYFCRLQLKVSVPVGIFLRTVHIKLNKIVENLENETMCLNATRLLVFLFP